MSYDWSSVDPRWGWGGDGGGVGVWSPSRRQLAEAILLSGSSFARSIGMAGTVAILITNEDRVDAPRRRAQVRVLVSRNGYRVLFSAPESLNFAVHWCPSDIRWVENPLFSFLDSNFLPWWTRNPLLIESLILLYLVRSSSCYPARHLSCTAAHVWIYAYVTFASSSSELCCRTLLIIVWSI